MIPTSDECRRLWDKYGFPQAKRRHVMAVLAIADVLALQLSCKHPDLDRKLLTAAVMLHDIDKNVPKLPGEHHPDAAVRVVVSEGCRELTRIITRHPLHMILDGRQAPETIEERILFLADKMAKYEPIGVEERFALWNAETDIKDDGKRVLQSAYPMVVALCQKLCGEAGLTENQVIALAKDKFSTSANEFDAV